MRTLKTNILMIRILSRFSIIFNISPIIIVLEFSFYFMVGESSETLQNDTGTHLEE